MKEAPVAGCCACHDKRWVCEKHSDQPWPHGDCDEPATPCLVCNTSEPPEPTAVFRHVERWSVNDNQP
jgi:hypothetical protein